MKKLRDYEVFELQEEIKKRENFDIQKTLETIKSITDNYNMGMITQMETMTQINELSGLKIKEFANL